jgi:hypothetical protein
MRPSLRCGVHGCHLCGGTGLYLCHSHCLLRLLLPPACRCPFHCEVSFPASNDRCLDCLLQSFDRQRRLQESYRWSQKLQVTYTMTFLSLPVFVAADEHIQSKAVQLESFRLASSTPPMLFLRQLVHNGTFFHSILCTWLQPSTLWKCQCGNVCGGGILWAISLVVKR